MAVGGLRGGKKVYLCIPKSTPDQLDHLGMESPFSWKQESIGLMIELAWKVNGAELPELLLS